jgi:hypothetical protein
VTIMPTETAKPPVTDHQHTVVSRESIYIWPPITEEERADLKQKVFRGKRFTEERQLDLSQEAARSVLTVPLSDAAKETLKAESFSYVERVAKQTNRKQMRFGWQGENMLLAFNSQLSASEIKVCEEADAEGVTGLNLSRPTINTDESVTYLTSQNRQNSSYRKKMYDFQERAFELIATALTGVVACRAVVLIIDDTNTLTLFNGDSPRVLGEAEDPKDDQMV